MRKMSDFSTLVKIRGHLILFYANCFGRGWKCSYLIFKHVSLDVNKLSCARAFVDGCVFFAAKLVRNDSFKSCKEGFSHKFVLNSLPMSKVA